MISGSLIQKWTNMVRNESIFHVNQVEGAFYSRDEVRGYYNDLRQKVLYTTNIDEKGIPFNVAVRKSEKKIVYFPIAIFQYGLGAYDLYLERDEPQYRDKMLTMADWAIRNQQENGSWNAFGILDYTCAFSSMAQGEGASLLVRAYILTGDQAYLASAQKAIHFMLIPLEQGGTAAYTEDGLILLEYPKKAAVLNGWIFSAFGLFDVWKITSDNQFGYAWQEALRGIAEHLSQFDAGHWSYYDLSGKYTSPFYHKLHIELLKAVNSLSYNAVFEQYIDKWTKYKDSSFWTRIAFLNKAMQKILEKKSNEWIIVN